MVVCWPGPRGLGRDFWRLCDALWFLLCSPSVLFENLRNDFRKFGATIRAGDNSSGFGHEPVSKGRRVFRKKLQKLFKSWSDVQAVTGYCIAFRSDLAE
jgi:hypothetical protein